jgi:uncharacterized protein YdeI (YjbR/CyaY-like superfamily)
MKPTFFATPQDFRSWLEAHHATERELLVGFYKRGFGKPSISWPESVDEALCFGWIDGVRKSLSEEAYSIRFTPRRATSIWSAINVARVAALESLGRMAPAGRRAFAARTPERTGVYSHDRSEPAQFTTVQLQRLRAHPAAAAFFDAQPPWYRRTATHWVVSAKREDTRERRLDQLIADSAESRTIGALTRSPGKRKPAADKPVASRPPSPRSTQTKEKPTGKRSASPPSAVRRSKKKAAPRSASRASARRTQLRGKGAR